ncbi:TPA: hypothetical protein ACHKED_005537 [Escherichia coli]|uniref:hypothetical protein n=1 Tax=Escherichia coli TaxID=562 RepID=UPI001CDA0633|nr:hypothetical protein [Escherichia coli]EJE1495171.1 hypothetical protein [Escherichia coli]EJQ1825845.1 hypothetical protein [Escherichia coli]MCA2043979.1 hypothetical protein [Escherichia coli]MCA2058930.1 hypothetical protein [Escherichia coli]MCA2126051.1 hypothetical protein [Escherichia coli]
MSHFRDLYLANKKSRDARREVTGILRNQAEKLVAFYEQWLELPSETWEDKDGEHHRYVDTGFPCRNDRDFRPLPVNMIATDTDNIFRMAVRTWVDSHDEGESVNIVLAMELHSVGKDGVSLRVRVEDDTSIRVVINGDGDREWLPIVNSMKMHIISKLQRRTPSAFR